MQYQILRKMAHGKLLHVASRRSLHEARELIRHLKQTFAGHYVVREAKAVATVDSRRRAPTRPAAVQLGFHLEHSVKLPEPVPPDDDAIFPESDSWDGCGVRMKVLGSA
jgi:hypothetical protein